MTAQWEQDLALAEEHQELVRTLLDDRTGRFGHWVVSKGYEPNQDLIWRWRCSHDGDMCEHRIECKEDFKCYDTGNIAVEIASHVPGVAAAQDSALADTLSGTRPSGLSRTRAHSIVYTSHVYRPSTPLQTFEGHPGVRCMEVTWRMSPVALWKAVKDWGKDYHVWTVSTKRDPEHSAQCYIIEGADGFIEKVPGMIVLDQSPCRHPWRHQ